MADAIKKLESEVLTLPKEDRAELARVLLLSLDSVADEGDDLAWAEEAERRYRELQKGRVDAIPSSEVFGEAHVRLK